MDTAIDRSRCAELFEFGARSSRLPLLENGARVAAMIAN